MSPSALPVLALDLRATPEIAGDLAAIGRDLEDSGIGAVIVSGDAEAGELHPIHAAAALAPHTRSIGLIARTDAVDVEPFHLATQLMSLDHISHGRAGWAVEAREDEAAARAVGREPLTGAALAQESADVVRASRRVWDSWADDAVVRDDRRGVYLDAARLQYVDYQGATFFVRGPSITPRSPQGLTPVLVADEDATAVGDETRALADGWVLDVDLGAERADDGDADSRRDPQPSAAAIAQAVRDALAASASAAASDGSSPGLVRLRGLSGLGAPGGDLARVLAETAEILRSEGLIAPAPSSDSTLRDQLGLTRPEALIDPERRTDRARIAAGDRAA